MVRDSPIRIDTRNGLKPKKTKGVMKNVSSSLSKLESKKAPNGEALPKTLATSPSNASMKDEIAIIKTPTSGFLVK